MKTNAIQWRSTGANHAIGVIDTRRVIVQECPQGDYTVEVSDDATGEVYHAARGFGDREHALSYLVGWLNYVQSFQPKG